MFEIITTDNREQQGESLYKAGRAISEIPHFHNNLFDLITVDCELEGVKLRFF